MWQSDKLALCQPGAIPEYAWLYGLADANGNFELTNLRTLHSKAYAPIRPGFTVENLKTVLADFERHGLLYTWTEGAKRYGHWTGSQKPGRLPPPAQRDRYAGNLVVRSLYKTPDQPCDPGLIEYLERTASPAPDPQIALPLPEEKPFARTELAFALRKEAEHTVDLAQTPATDTAEFRKFKKLYPEAGWVHESYTRSRFAQLARDGQCEKIMEGLARHVASQNWKQGYCVDSDRFLDESYWEKPPREVTSDNGKQRIIGPAGRTTEDYIERNRKIRKTLGTS